MNIFAKIIFTSHETLKEIFLERVEMDCLGTIGSLQIYKKTEEETNLVLIFGESQNFQEALDYSRENYEILKFLCLGIGVPTDSLDIKMGDVMVPNTFINKENEAVFSEYVIDQNYDLNEFGLVLNGICLSLEEQISTEEELAEIKEKYACEIMDFEAFFQTKTLEKYELLDKSVIIKAIGSSKEELTHAVDISQLMI